MRRRLRTAQEGFTIVEVTISIMLLSVGLLAFLQSFLPVQSSVRTSENATLEASIAEQQLEKMFASGYSCLALASAPTSSSNPNDPGYYVHAGSPPTFQWDLTNASALEPLVVSATVPSGCGAALSPTSSWSLPGGKSGTLYRFVTWVDDPLTCTPTTATCPTSNDYKRVTLMVTHNGPGAPFKPVLLSTIVSDPNAGPGGMN